MDEIIDLCFGSPGNITVMNKIVTLEKYNTENIINKSNHTIFETKYPKYAGQSGWLWIIYKYYCDHNINKTITFIQNL